MSVGGSYGEYLGEEAEVELANIAKQIVAPGKGSALCYIVWPTRKEMTGRSTN